MLVNLPECKQQGFRLQEGKMCPQSQLQLQSANEFQMASNLLCCSKCFLDPLSSSQFPLLRTSLKSNYQTNSRTRQQKKHFPQSCRDCSDSAKRKKQNFLSKTPMRSRLSTVLIHQARVLNWDERSDLGLESLTAFYGIDGNILINCFAHFFPQIWVKVQVTLILGHLSLEKRQLCNSRFIAYTLFLVLPQWMTLASHFLSIKWQLGYLLPSHGC